MEKLSSFSHEEVQMILCGNQSPSWAAEDIINYTEPKLGYTRDRYVLIISKGQTFSFVWKSMTDFLRTII